jgi:DNA adenine methylase
VAVAAARLMPSVNFDTTSERAKENGEKERSVPVAKPFLRWAGSKRKLLPQICAFCPLQYRTYVEPFAGSACLFFMLQPTRAILGDFNTELMTTYRTVASHPRAISNCLRAFPTTEDFYYDLRDQHPMELDAIRRAARFIYLNRFSFNGVYRTNRQGDFNVPRGTKTGQLPNFAELKRCAVALKSARCIANDFEATIDKARANDFVYLDPPYSLASDRHRGEYGYGGFSSDDLLRLRQALQRLDARGAAFVLSYRCTKEVREMFGEWHQKTLTVRRHVAGFAKDRRNVREMLISNRSLATSK